MANLAQAPEVRLERRDRMTSIQKVESMCARTAQRSLWPFLQMAILCLLVWGLAGCAGGPLGNVGSLFNRSGSTGPPQPITLAPIIGPPAKVSKELSSQISTAAKAQNIPVVSGSAAVYTVRGYLTTSPDGKNHKLAYIWDVTEKSGKRVHRVLGEQIIPGKPGANPWSLVDQKTLKAIATKTVADLGSWLPKQKAAAVPVAAAAPASRPVAAATQRASPSSVPAKPGEFFAMVPAVKGAPGDGQKTLTVALKKQLFSKGVKLTNSKGTNVYTVAGLVKLNALADNQEKIAIQWNVSDPSGKKLGTVSQENTIAKGSLNNQWGKTADAAAAAAADGIIKLLPKAKK